MTRVEVQKNNGTWVTHYNVDKAEALNQDKLLIVEIGNEGYYYPYYSIFCWKVTEED